MVNIVKAILSDLVFIFGLIAFIVFMIWTMFTPKFSFSSGKSQKSTTKKSKTRSSSSRK